VINPAIERVITGSSLELALRGKLSHTYETPSITMFLTPVWAKAAPANNAKMVKIDILKGLYECKCQLKRPYEVKRK
jgi:hypothetical protein